ncbi:hypothetical protein [Crenobacter intestini]|uniref:Uncharacterized protein n=1 Tax=Crenobacter intestini TaxID=2563443 RepID=A0A4T0UJR2_9NEIS|nr:hypothetical protein [Crenobacter intestini]TIC78551.1 hypothetical protein E5K04_15660 [Crenobacter intestini]
MHGFDEQEVSALFFTVRDGEQFYTAGRCKASELPEAANVLRREGKGELSGVVDKDTLESLLAEIVVFERERGTARPLFGWWREPEESFVLYGRESHAPIRCKPSQIYRQVAAWQRDGQGEVVNVIQRSTLAAFLAELMIFEREHGINANPSFV